MRQAELVVVLKGTYDHEEDIDTLAHTIQLPPDRSYPFGDNTDVVFYVPERRIDDVAETLDKFYGEDVFGGYVFGDLEEVERDE